MFTSYSCTELQTVHTATYIVENSIADDALRGNSEFRRTLKDGLLASVTRGGVCLRTVPNFLVEYVGSARDVPKRPPHPSNLDAVAAASISEQRLALGDKKDNQFVYEDSSAHDADKGITITSIRKFEEISFDDPMPYIYSQGDQIFEFRAAKYREWRLAPDGPFKGKLVRPHTATYVIEESIKQGMMKANSAAAEYHELKQNIKDGMWVVETRGGSALRDIPDFRLEFVNRTKDAPNCPPRRLVL
jgi:hypothetical protein